jgi:hypothetical protein
MLKRAYAAVMRNLARTGAAGLALATVLLSNPVAAHAADPLQHVGGAGCAYAGSNTFRCFENFTGGTAPYSATGSTSNGYASITRITITLYSASSFEVAVWGRCTYNQATTMTVNVSDSSGQTVTLRRNVPCGSEGSGI